MFLININHISLAGFSKDYYNEGKDVLNEKVKLAILTKKEKEDAKKLILKRHSIYSDNDYIVPFKLLEEFCQDIDSEAMLIKKYKFYLYKILHKFKLM